LRQFRVHAGSHRAVFGMPNRVRREPIPRSSRSPPAPRAAHGPRVLPAWDRDTALGLLGVAAITFTASAAFLYLLGFSVLVEGDPPPLRTPRPTAGHETGCTAAAIDRRSNRTTPQDCPLETSPEGAITAQLVPPRR
jgi:hypothetical protein